MRTDPGKIWLGVCKNLPMGKADDFVFSQIFRQKIGTGSSVPWPRGENPQADDNPGQLPPELLEEPCCSGGRYSAKRDEDRRSF